MISCYKNHCSLDKPYRTQTKRWPHVIPICLRSSASMASLIESRLGIPWMIPAIQARIPANGAIRQSTRLKRFKLKSACGSTDVWGQCLDSECFSVFKLRGGIGDSMNSIQLVLLRNNLGINTNNMTYSCRWEMIFCRACLK